MVWKRFLDIFALENISDTLNELAHICREIGRKTKWQKTVYHHPVHGDNPGGLVVETPMHGLGQL